MEGFSTIMLEMIEKDWTVREAAEVLEVPKSTLHVKLTRFATENPDNSIVCEWEQLMRRHWREKHLKGGEQTRRKYELAMRGVLTKGGAGNDPL